MLNLKKRGSRVRSFSPSEGTRSFGVLGSAPASPEEVAPHAVVRRRRNSLPVIAFLCDAQLHADCDDVA